MSRRNLCEAWRAMPGELFEEPREPTEEEEMAADLAELEAAEFDAWVDAWESEYAEEEAA